MTVYHDMNAYDYHTLYICLSTVFGENTNAESHLRLDNNFPLNCSLAPPHVQRRQHQTQIISNLHPTSKYKSKFVVWECFGYRKDECSFVLEDRHSSQKLVTKRLHKEETHRTCLPIFQNTIPLCRYSYVPLIT